MKPKAGMVEKQAMRNLENNRKECELMYAYSAEQKKEILRARAQQLRLEEEKDCAGQTFVGLQFLLADENYAVESLYISEVVRLKDLTPLPCTPAFILGIINVRGKIIAVIDLKKLFNLPEKAITDVTRVIVVKHAGIELAVLADEIIGSLSIDVDKLHASITTSTGIGNDYLKGVTVDRVIVLDLAKFILDETLVINQQV